MNMKKVGNVSLICSMDLLNHIALMPIRGENIINRITIFNLQSTTEKTIKSLGNT